jgi:flagellar biosynthesis/type III secretory pathway chaperone
LKNLSEPGAGSSPSGGAAWLIEQIGQEISLLNQLHVLSQTQSLVLQNGQMEALDEIVSQRESVIAELASLSERITEEVRATGPCLSQGTVHETQSLAFLKTEAMELLHRIQQIDSQNRLRLEEFRTGAIQSSHQLQQELKLHRAYDFSQLPATTQLSKMAE